MFPKTHTNEFKRHMHCFIGHHDSQSTERSLYLSCFPVHPVWTYAFGPSYFMIFTAQSSVLLYLWASRPCQRRRTQVSNPADSWSLGGLVTPPTCILVLMTSRGVFPNTLAAPATAPNAPVKMGLMALLGSSPWWFTKKVILDLQLTSRVCYCRFTHTPLYQFLSTVMT